MRNRNVYAKVVALVVPLLILAACGTDRESGSPVDTSLELTGVAEFCPSGDVENAIAAIFPTPESLHHVATVNCGQVFSDFGKGKQTEAVQKAFAFFVKTLQQNEAGQLLVSGEEGEADIIELFTLILTGIGMDLPDVDPEDLADALLSGEYAVGPLVPGGPPLITISKHAGMDDDGGLFGPVTAVIIMIPPNENEVMLSSVSHPCPAGVVNTFDCYPLFFDYSVSPVSNVNPAVGLQLGQCNVSPEGVEVELLSPEGFLPLDDAPAGLDCTDVEPEVAMTGWRSYAWTVLEPVSPLFHVTPAFAGQSPIGGRISNFSPVAPADPESGDTETLGSISGTVFDIPNESTFPGATVELLAGESVIATTSAGDAGAYSFPDLGLGTYTVRASAPGYFSDTSEPVTLTEESPDASDVNLALGLAIG
ncbi:MAG TPA: carboxypeptidase-like regulatory domain-containing protein [Gemmatimonadota bacterium]|nr:carboxypeptidase-like regulatory domain-containing protein [Gemmatimonadota bacterium]